MDLRTGEWANTTTGVAGRVQVLPDLVLEIVESGGVMPRLAARGFLPADPVG